MDRLVFLCHFSLGNMNIMNFKSSFESFLGNFFYSQRNRLISKLLGTRPSLTSSNYLTNGEVVGQLITGPSWLTASWMKKWDVSPTRWAFVG